MIYATNSGNGTSFTPVDAGSHVARCYSMIHIGHVTENYMGEEKVMNKVRLTWELPNERKEFKPGEGEKPFSVSKEYTLSMHEKATLRKDLEGWRGKSFTDLEAKKFDITNLLGKPCLISVIHKTSKEGRLYAQISSISKMGKGMTCPDQFNDTFELNYEDKWDPEVFETLPDYLKAKMKGSQEYQKIINPETSTVADEPNSEVYDELPF